MERFKLSPQRSRILFALMGILGAVFVVRLFYLQVVINNYYEAEANKEHTSKFTIPAKRGLIYARDGSNFAPLVLNEPEYTVYADPRYIKDDNKVADDLRKIAGGNVITNFEDGLQDKTRQYVVLAKGLNKSQVGLLNKDNLD